MSYEPLHHKYRPQTFADLVGQSSIATTLTNAIALKRIAPAYLFTGPRGTGKTSSARILAKSLNCIRQDQPTASPCGACEVCQRIALGNALDVIEIDAASNTGVDNIREIIERAQFAPVQCRYKVYVIDECHMLSVAAFNALLKTLEEPPKNVVFVLATTDPQRVLPTIISRCQRFDFRRIPLEDMVTHLSGIAANENINITPDALTLVAQVAQGGLRDAESLLDQLSLLPGQVTAEAVWDLVGAVPERDLLTLSQAIASDDAQTVLEQCRNLMDKGREPLVVLQNLAGFYRDLLIAKTAPQRSDLVAVTPPTWTQLCEFAQQQDTTKILFWSQHLKNSEAQVKNTTQPRLWLEVTLLGLLPSALSLGLANPKEDRSYSSNGLKTSIRDRPNTNRDHPKGNSETNRITQSEQPAYPSSSAQAESNSNIEATTSVELQTKHAPRSQAQLSNPTTSAIDSTNGISPTQGQSPSASPQISCEPETPASVSHSATQEATPSTTNGEPVGLEDIWQNVVNQIKFRSTRELMRQHCGLLTFNGQQATISLSAKGLLRLTQSKLPEVEAAFQVVYKTNVKVSLQPVDSTAPNTATASVQPYSQEDSTESPTSHIAVKPTQEAVVTELASYPPKEQVKSLPSDSTSPYPSLRQLQGTSTPIAAKEHVSAGDDLRATRLGVDNLERSPASPKDLTGVQLETGSSPSVTVVPVSPELLSPHLESEWDADDVEKALTDLKQFFEGEIVELTDETRLSQQTTSSHTNQLEPQSKADTKPLQSNGLATYEDIQENSGGRDWRYDDEGELEF